MNEVIWKQYRQIIDEFRAGKISREVFIQEWKVIQGSYVHDATY